MNRSGGATDLANNDFADYTDQSVAKKTDTPRSSINTQGEQRWGVWVCVLYVRKANIQHYLVQNNSSVKVVNRLHPI